MYKTGMFLTHRYLTMFELTGIEGSSDDFSFGDYGLQNAKVITTDDGNEAMAKTDIIAVDNPSNDGRRVLDTWFRSKTIPIEGFILVDSEAEAGTELRRLKRALAQREAELKIYMDGIRFIYDHATVSNTSSAISRESFDRLKIEYRITFEVSKGFGYGVTPNLSSSSGINVGVQNLGFDNDGDYRSIMDFLLVFQNANNVTSVKIENLTNGGAIEILESISTGDVLRIDGETKKVYLGPTSIGYDGRHIFSEVGSNEIQITVTSTSHEYNVTMTSNYILL